MTTPTPLVIVGAGGHGRETVSLVLDVESSDPGRWELLGVVADDEPDLALLTELGVGWLGPVSWLEEHQTSVSIAVGDSATRRLLQSHITARGCQPATLAHPDASIGSAVTIGAGGYVGAQSALTANVVLGAGVQVNVGCTLSHDVVLGDFVTLAPGVHLAGGVSIDDEATVFTGATLLPGVHVGRGATVGAGAVVTKDVADGETVVGVPARPLRQA